MPIQWFPGHMTSARKKAGEAMEFVDVVIEVLDARLPEASTNPMVRELRLLRQRPCLKLLNKADLADPEVTTAWLAYYNAQPDVKAVAVSCKKAGDVARIPALARQLAPHRNDRLKPLRMMIMGIPNVGKSTLMNALLKRKVAAVGDEPAVTKHQQRMELSPTSSLIDTPGMMWPKIAHDSDGYMLAASHAIGRNAVIEEEVATFLAGILLARYPEGLRSRYGFDAQTFAALDAVGVLEGVARRRGCIAKGRGGELDLERAALLFLQDYRDGALGRVSLETPQTRAAMLVESEAKARELAAAKALAGGAGARKLDVVGEHEADVDRADAAAPPAAKKRGRGRRDSPRAEIASTAKARPARPAAAQPRKVVASGAKPPTKAAGGRTGGARPNGAKPRGAKVSGSKAGGGKTRGPRR